MKKSLKWICLFWLIYVAIGIGGKKVEAAGLEQVLPNKTYTNYDVTGDGKKDVVKYEYVHDTRYDIGIVKVYVNGKQCIYREGGKNGIQLDFCHFSDGSTFFVINTASTSVYAGIIMEFVDIFQYSDGKFINIMAPHHTDTEILKISGNTLYIASQMIGGILSFSSLKKNFDMPPCIIKYQAKNGKLKLVSREYEFTGTTAKKTFYAQNSFKTSKSVAGINTKNGPVVKKGQKVILEKVYILGKKAVEYYRINVNGKSGWFQSQDSIQLARTAPKKMAQTISASNKVKTLGGGKFNLGAKITKGNGKLSYKVSNSKVVTISKSGIVTIKGVGKTNITITASATSSYKSTSKTITVTVRPKGSAITSLRSNKSGVIKINWKKNSIISGYQIQYATTSSFSNAKTVTVNKSTSTGKTIKGFSGGKTYYFRVRTYKTVSKKNYYSKWSSTKKTQIVSNAFSLIGRWVAVTPRPSGMAFHEMYFPRDMEFYSDGFFIEHYSNKDMYGSYHRYGNNLTIIEDMSIGVLDRVWTYQMKTNGNRLRLIWKNGKYVDYEKQ